ncbi:hypothetical protein BBF96_03735 [Anoxybacter fermentans]|uniref:Secretin/TonB short N-terminal domain-containing protein n=1 Tax=Anoxybacter fermentans TaxID=1323375 RepID=A0A3S9SW78_9FIRM|nr:secretin and TonB N-terminal domain-containing protein [Anoxybacter fermentans]AZR72573.1 hypothetical protein BBF96_03735 [Anoxybacter fermentans]
MKRKTILTIVIICFLSFFSTVFAEGLITLSIKEGDIRDVLKMMGEQSGINIVPDSSVRGQVTLTLTDVTVEDALETLLKVYHYYYEKVNSNTYIISQEPLKEPYLIEVEDGKLTLVAQNIDIKRIINDIARKGQLNIIYDQSINGQVNANLILVDIYEGLKSLCSANNLLLMEREGIYTITTGMVGQKGRQMVVNYSKGLLSIDVKSGDLTDLLRAIAEQSGIDIVLFGGNHQLVDLKLKNIPVDDAIEMILSGTRYTYKKVGNVYLIGDKSINSPSSSLLIRNEVIHLRYLQAEKVPAMLPNIFPATNIKVIKELNALAVIGTQDDINELKAYLEKIDKKIPQIVIEAIIIEVSRNENNGPLYKLGIKSDAQEGSTVLLDTVLGKLTYNSVIKLTPEFYIHLENLIDQGVVTVKARPKITTLNGCQAKINVGTVQYYKTTTPAGDNNQQPQTQYQSINAGITLDVIPWVSSTDEITLELHPNVSNLGGATSDGPPQVSQRQIDTTVRVKSGETIIIGGLIQDVKTDTVSKVPILGDLPWIGKLFQRKTTNQNQNELIIYITPHILDEENETITPEEMQQTIEDMETRYNSVVGE